MRTLAIDLGTKRIGLAMSDEGGQWATPLDVLFVTAQDQAIAPIAALVAKEDVRRVVLGLPINMDDSIGPMARSVVAWADRLRPSIGTAEIVFVDERLSSYDAEQTLIANKRAGAKMTRKDKKQALDAVAAASFLQAFLDGKLGAIDV
ncbi:MAG TPA: Holliday junction resolvase RuvX [Tepidisphaeraceae bacterium]|jgi:putative Holliday junction resolvase